MVASECRVALARQLASPAPPDLVAPTMLAMSGRVVVVVGAGGADVQAAALKCREQGWPVVVLAAAAGVGGASAGVLPVAGISGDEVRIFDTSTPPAHLGTLLHVLLTTSPPSRNARPGGAVGAAGVGEGAGE